MHRPYGQSLLLLSGKVASCSKIIPHAQVARLYNSQTLNPGRSTLATSKLRDSTTSDYPDVDLRSLVSLELVKKIAEIAGELEDGMRSLLSVQDQVIYWTSDLIRQVANQHSSGEILSAVQGSPLLRVQMQLLTETTRDENSVVREAAQILSKQVSKDLLQNLALRDQAPEHSVPFSGFSFVASFGKVCELRAETLGSLHTEFSEEDLAARFVSLSHILGVNSGVRLSDFNQELFEKFAPENSPLYTKELKPNVNVNDVAWASRRKYIRGRAKPPVQASSNE